MLNVLMQRKVGYVFAVVVRYFGGVKLGAGGLVRAYGRAVSGAVDEADLYLVVPQQELSISIGFALEQKVRNELLQNHMSVLETRY